MADHRVLSSSQPMPRPAVRPPRQWGPAPGFGPLGTYNSTEHTNSLIPLFAKGAGSELFAQYAANSDPGLSIHGGMTSTYYIDNTHIFRVMLASVPEPSSILALMAGLVGLVGLKLRRRN